MVAFDPPAAVGTDAPTSAAAVDAVAASIEASTDAGTAFATFACDGEAPLPPLVAGNSHEDKM